MSVRSQGAEELGKVPAVRLPATISDVPGEEVGLHIIDAYASLYPQWAWEVDGRSDSFPVDVVRAAWRDHVRSDFDHANGNTLFHVRFLRAPIPVSDGRKWLPARDALRARWLECFQSMLQTIHGKSAQSAVGWGR